MYFYITPANMPTLQESDIQKYDKQSRTLNWTKFDTQQLYQNRLWIVSMDGENWRQGICTCLLFLKQYICKHIVGKAILRNYFQVSAEAKTVPLGQKRKKGRSAATKKALIVQ